MPTPPMPKPKYGLAALAMKSTLLILLSISSSFAQSALTTERVASGLNQPLYLTHSPNDESRLYVVERAGRIRIIENGILLPTPFLNIQAQVEDSWLEWGLLGLAFHPNYESNGFFYVNYIKAGGHTVISRFSRNSSNPNLAEANSEAQILNLNQPGQNHRGGWLGFGPDNYLYDCQGDGGPQNDTNERAQDLSLLQGSILRIDVTGPDGIPGTADDDDFPADPNQNYAIPLDNPFVGVAGRDEIYAYGLRNPWRASFDRVNGDFWIGDVGQYAREEISLIPASSGGGQNFGWRCREGFICTNFSGCPCTSPDYVDPVIDYTHADGVSVTGGYVYQGCAIPDLVGTYFYADYASANIWSLRYDGVNISELTDRTAELDPAGSLSIQSISSFGEDARGELYMLDYTGGEVFKIVALVPPLVDPCLIGGGFVRGDANEDQSLDLSDAITSLSFLFTGASVNCENSLDTNDDDTIDIADVVSLLAYLFSGAPNLPDPQVCGPDPTPGTLTCNIFGACP